MTGSVLLASACWRGKDHTGRAAADAWGAFGDVPGILGKWPTAFAVQTFTGSSGIAGLGRADMGWLEGCAMVIRRTAPNALYAIIGGGVFDGVETEQGGVVFTGVHEQKGHALPASFGGLLFGNEYLDRDDIWGHGYMGVDATGDGAIDCGLQGDGVAQKSGS